MLSWRTGQGMAPALRLPGLVGDMVKRMMKNNVVGGVMERWERESTDRMANCKGGGEAGQGVMPEL